MRHYICTDFSPITTSASNKRVHQSVALGSGFPSLFLNYLLIYYIVSGLLLLPVKRQKSMSFEKR